MQKRHPATPKTVRQAAYNRGRLAERLALLLLRIKGYRLMARGYKRPVGEIDLIMKRGRQLVFVEVKQRATQALAAEAITPRQKLRITRAAQAFLQENPSLSRNDLRFDTVLLAPGTWPRHLKNAWHS
ncbi:YraN family protein [Rhodovibrionaceae bacterium A322]